MPQPNTPGERDERSLADAQFSPQLIMAALCRRGSSLNAWATAHGYRPRTVYATVSTWGGRTDRAPLGGLGREIMAKLRQDLGSDVVPSQPSATGSTHTMQAAESTPKSDKLSHLTVRPCPAKHPIGALYSTPEERIEDLAVQLWDDAASKEPGSQAETKAWERAYHALHGARVTQVGEAEEAALTLFEVAWRRYVGCVVAEIEADHAAWQRRAA